MQVVIYCNLLIFKVFKRFFKKTLGHYCQYVNEKCPGFRDIREICNGTKHLRVRERISDTRKRDGGFSGGFNAKSFDTDDLLIDDNDGNILIFKEIIELVVQFWKEMFKKLKI